MTTEPENPTPEWSDGATVIWADYTARIQERLRNDDADPDEVIADLRAHLEEEQRRRGLSILTRGDMILLLRRFGLPDVPVAEDPAYPAKKKRGWFAGDTRFGRTMSWLFLVALPAFTLLDELLFRDATLMYRDLFPHPLLFWMAAAVPVQKAYYLVKRRRTGRPLEEPLDRALNGFATAVSLWFSALLLPMMMVAAMGAFVFFWTGIGLLGFLVLSPLFCALHGLAAETWPRLNPRCFEASFLLGGLAAVILGMAAYGRIWQQEYALGLAVDGSGQEQAKGLRLLQDRFSDRDLFQRLLGPGSRSNPLPFAGPDTFLDRDERRELLYAATGKTFDEFPVKETGWLGAGLFWGWGDGDWWRDFDPDLGGTEVGSPQEDIQLVSSRLDGSIDPEGLLSYTEWTLVFENHSSFRQAEARCLIGLPSGAVVSRVTLWINGEPREAAFGGTAQVRQAYESVVRRRRDPLLVTQAGLDRVLAQCFPILPGETMKIRLGVTAPLVPATDGTAAIPMPWLVDSNIGHPAGRPEVSVWLESDAPFEAADRAATRRRVEEEELYVLETPVAMEDVSAFSRGLRLGIDGPLPTAFAESPRLEEGTLVLQRWEAQTAAPTQTVLLLDRSSRMKPFAEEVRALLSGLPDTVVAVAVSGFPAESFEPGEAERLAEADNFHGGHDPLDALRLALKLADRHGAERIVWLRAPSPYLFDGEEALLQFTERRSNLPEIYSLTLSPGVDAVASRMLPPFRFAEISIPTDPDAKGFRDLLEGKGLLPPWRAVRETVAEAPPEAERTSDHLVRLWARDRIFDQLTLGGRDPDPARRLGVVHQLVTPVSGAVVLETAAQYKANDLEPVDPDSVPSIPEPETWLLLMVLLGFIAALRRRAACRV